MEKEYDLKLNPTGQIYFISMMSAAFIIGLIKPFIA